MRSVESTIAQAIVYDHNPTSGALAIIAALRAEGYEVVVSNVDLPEIRRIFGDTVVSAEQAVHLMGLSYEMGQKIAREFNEAETEAAATELAGFIHGRKPTQHDRAIARDILRAAHGAKAA